MLIRHYDAEFIIIIIIIIIMMIIRLTRPVHE